jgi:hypothetical protein
VAHGRIIFAGPTGAGKTSAIACLSDEAPITAGETLCDARRGSHQTVNTPLDFGVLNLPGGEQIHLFSAPGWTRADSISELLASSGLGLVILLDNSRPDPFQDLRFFLKAFERLIGRTGAVVGITHMDVSSTPKLDSYVRELQGSDRLFPVFEVDARAKPDVIMLLRALLVSLHPNLRAE